ncbi:MAG: outer membrane protein transport protein [Acidobacteriota bacterium]
MKNIFKAALLLILTFSLSAGLFSNGLSLNGIGSRASAMGTAYIGLADDFSAVFFNPAGLTQMENSSLSLFVTDIFPSGTYKFEFLGNTLADTKSVSQGYPSGSLAYFKPLSDKIVAGFAVYVPSGVGAEWPGDSLAMLTGGKNFKWNSKIFMITASPVIAYKLSDKLSIGASININYVELFMERPGGGDAIPYFQYEEDLSTIALGATIGLMYKPSDILSLGLTWKAPVNADIKGTAKAPFLANLGIPAESEGTRSATWPMWFGAGIAVKPCDKMIITADVTYNNWEKLQNIPIEFENAGWKAAGMEEGTEFGLLWENTVDFKFGVEYKLSDTFALRGGFYTDKSPSPEETLNIMLPSLHYNAFTFGFGYKKGKLSADFAVEYLTGAERFVDPMNYNTDAGMPGTHGMKIIVPNITISYKLGN